MKTFKKDDEIVIVHPRATDKIEKLVSEGWVEVDLGS